MKNHKVFMKEAFEQAKQSFDSGGVPVGAALVRGNELVSVGHNQRVQLGDPIAHGEMDCLRNAGRQTSYRDCTLYTTLSPCMMCTGTILQFKIPRVVIGENLNFEGNIEYLRENGVEVIVLNDDDCIQLMKTFIEEKPELWFEDIAEE